MGMRVIDIASAVDPSARLSRQSVLLRLGAAAIGGFLVMGGCLWAFGNDIDPLTVMVSLAFCLLCLPLFFVQDAFHPFLLFAGLQAFVLVNFVDKSSSRPHVRYALWSQTEAPGYIMESLLIIIVWYLLLYIGYLFPTFRRASKILSSKIHEETQGLRYAGVISYLLFGTAVLAFLYTLQRMGGIGAMLDAMVNRREAYAGLGYLRNAVSLAGVAALLLLTAGKPKFAFSMAVTGTLMMAMFGGRSAAVLGTLLPFLIGYHYIRSRIGWIRILLFIAGGILFFLLWGNLRMKGELQMESMSFRDAMFQAANQLQTADIMPALVGSLELRQVEYGNGQPLLNLLYAPIPRSIWADKPIIDETGVIGHELMGSDYWGLPPGPYGWAFYNFSWLGVILMAFVTGWLIQWIYRKFVLERNRSKYGLLGIVYYALIIQSVSNVFATSAQIRILWMMGVVAVIFGLEIMLTSIFREKSTIGGGDRYVQGNPIY